MNGRGSVGLPWVAVLSFIRIATNPRVLENPLDVRSVCAQLRSWLNRPQKVLIHPGDRHAHILFDLFEAVGSGGNLTTDAHLSALAIEHQATLHSTDADMERFPGLSWVNPFV